MEDFDKLAKIIPVDNPVGTLQGPVEEILGGDVVDRAGVPHLSQGGGEGGVLPVLNQDIWSFNIGSQDH